MSGWAHPSRDLFRAGRGAMAPTAADRERVRARLAAKLGAAAMGAAITTTSTATGAAGGTAGAGGTVTKGGGLALFAKLGVSIVILGGVASIATSRLLSHRDPIDAATATSLVAPVTAPSSTNEAAPVATATNTISVDDLPSAPKAPATAAPKKTAAASDPAEEARMVAQIDEALRSSDTARALAHADEHAKKFPNGVLVEEREGGRAIARCMAGSRSSADAFLAAHPRSPMRVRILAACGTKE